MIEQKPIKLWKYNKRTFASSLGVNEKIAYCGETILYMNKEFGTRWVSRAYPTQTFLTYPSPVFLSSSDCKSNYEMECIILKYLVERHQFDHSLLTEKEAKHWRFWKYLDLAKLPTINCLPPQISSSLPDFLTLSPKGINGGSYEKDPSNICIYQHFRLDNFFFEGPKIANLTLEDRKALRQAIFDALDPAAGFSLKDAFVLFDYEKIPVQRWYFNDGDISESIDLYPGYLRYGSSRKDDEYFSSYNHSIEEIWAKCPDFVTPMIESATSFIKNALSNAIIKED